MSSGTIYCKHSCENLEYKIEAGFRDDLVIKMQSEWSQQKAEVLREVFDSYGAENLKNPKIAESALSKFNLVDLHWDWLTKGLACRSDEYCWFFLVVEDKVQGVCIVYHPKQSRIDGDNISYIDYLATAYESRNRPGYNKRFSGIGSILLSYIAGFSNSQLQYRFGFSLHSLPSAESYYTQLGMTRFDKDPDKQDLSYFEADRETAAAIAGNS